MIKGVSYSVTVYNINIINNLKKHIQLKESEVILLKENKKPVIS